MLTCSLVIMQWGNLLATRTRRLSIFQQNPFGKRTGNWRLFPAMGFALSMFALFNQARDATRFGRKLTSTGSWHPVRVSHKRYPYRELVHVRLALETCADHGSPFGLAAGLLTLDELRKLAVRHRIQPFAFLAW